MRCSRCLASCLHFCKLSTQNYPWQQSRCVGKLVTLSNFSTCQFNGHGVRKYHVGQMPPTSRLFATVSSFTCWKCGSEVERKDGLHDLLQTCSNCKVLQKLNAKGRSLNYFEVFKLPATYQIDLSKLSKAMKILQRNLHPDLFSMKTREEQQVSDELSAFVNKAYAVLHDPMERAEYLLKLKGVDSQAREQSITMDTEFLMAVMELNERVEEIQNTEDLAKFRKDNNEMLEGLNSQLQAAFTQNDIDMAVSVVSKMKYYDNVQKKLKIAQSRLGVVD